MAAEVLNRNVDPYMRDELAHARLLIDLVTESMEQPAQPVNGSRPPWYMTFPRQRVSHKER